MLHKKPGLNNPETYVLTHNRFNTYLVLIFKDLNKAENYKMPCRVSSHNEIEIPLSFSYLIVFKPKEYTQDYHNEKTDDKSFLFEIEEKKYFYVGEKVICFETKNTMLNCSSQLDFNVIKFPYAYGENSIYHMLHQKYIPFQEYETSTLKNEYQYLCKKDKELKIDYITDENEDIVEFENKFIN